MKKIVCTIAALSLLFVGCGKEQPMKAIVDGGEGGVAAAETEPKVTLPKVKPNQSESGAEENTESPYTSDESSSCDTAASVSDTADKSDVSHISADNSSSGNNKPSEDVSVAASEIPDELYYLEGIVYKVSGSSILISETDLEWIFIYFEDASVLKDVKVGDKVIAGYNGEIAESFPAQARKAYTIEVTEKAGCEYKLQRFTCRKSGVNLNFSLLVPENWSNMSIEYPTEGDFTDWGIRFTPENETKGLDISWHSSFSVREPYDIMPVTINSNKADRYGRDGKWRFYAYNNGYIAANTFYGEKEYDKYTDIMERMLETLEFESLDFIG